jgi:hypothetical protein
VLVVPIQASYRLNVAGSQLITCQTCQSIVLGAFEFIHIIKVGKLPLILKLVVDCFPSRLVFVVYLQKLGQRVYVVDVDEL